MKYFCLTLGVWHACLLALTPSYAQDNSAPAALLRIEATYTGEVFTLAKGGLGRGSRYMDNLDLTATLDLGGAGLLPRTQVFVYGLYNNGQSFSGEKAGDSFVISNIETGVQAARLFEAWVEHGFADARGSLKLGLYDLNSEFDALETADIFINSAHGIGVDISQSGLNGPSIFPTTALGARLDLKLNDHIRVRSALLEGTAGDPERPRSTLIEFTKGEGVLLAGEVEGNFAATRLLAGYWRYSARFVDVLASAQAGQDVLTRGNQGAYLRAESQLWRETTAQLAAAEQEEAVQGLRGFIRVGIAAGRFNPFTRFYAAGLVYTGLVSGRDADQLGLALAYGRIGARTRAAQLSQAQSSQAQSSQVQSSQAQPGLDGVSTLTRSETALELTYKVALTPWLTLQPDAQIIINPGSQRALKTAYAFGLRTTVSLDGLFQR